jgi:DNA-binding response OmpR family regulator
MHTATVLIVDRDLGFVFWLGHLLTQAGYQALPANSCDSGSDLITQLNLGIDMLIVGYSLPGASGLVEALRHSQNKLRVIAVLDAPDRPVPAFSGADAVHHRPSMASDASAAEWVETIKAVFARDDSKTRILPSKAIKYSG